MEVGLVKGNYFRRGCGYEIVGNDWMIRYYDWCKNVLNV